MINTRNLTFALITSFGFLSCGASDNIGAIQLLLNKDYIRRNISEQFKDPKENYDDWFNDIERDIDTTKMEALLLIAIDAEVELGDLSQYGLTKNSSSYVIDLSSYPTWLTISDLVNIVASSSFIGANSELLLEMGMSRSDLDEIVYYIEDQSFALIRSKATLQFIQSAKKKYKGKINKSNQDSYYLELNYLSLMTLREADRSWALGLLSRLSGHSKRVLFKAALRSGTTRTYVPDSLSYSEKKEYFFKSIFSDAFETRLSKQVKNLRQHGD